MNSDRLNAKQRELIAVGSSLAANCQKCANFHFKMVFEEGATLDEVNQAIRIANEVIESSQTIMQNWAESLLPEAKKNDQNTASEFDNQFEDLIRVGTAVALANPTNMRKYIDNAISSDVSEIDLRQTLRIAKIVRDSAEKFAREEIDEKWPAFKKVNTANKKCDDCSQISMPDAEKTVSINEAEATHQHVPEDIEHTSPPYDKLSSRAEPARKTSSSEDDGSKVEKMVQARTQEIKELSMQLSELTYNLEEKVQEETKIRQENEQLLIQQSKMAAMGEMISMIAHQWRQPLSSIGAVLTNLKVQFDLELLEPEFFKHSVQEVNNQIQYLSTTITDFRSFLSPTKQKLICFLDEIVDNTLKIIGKSLETSNITVKKEMAFKHPISVYSNELIQVFMNILKNAQDAFASNKIEGANIQIVGSETDAIQVIEISDNAGGIPEDILPKLFDSYFTTRGDGVGTGLGLYMSKTIVEKHCEGQLTVFNRGAGACFRIELPVVYQADVPGQ